MQKHVIQHFTADVEDRFFFADYFLQYTYEGMHQIILRNAKRLTHLITRVLIVAPPNLATVNFDYSPRIVAITYYFIYFCPQIQKIITHALYQNMSD